MNSPIRLILSSIFLMAVVCASQGAAQSSTTVPAPASLRRSSFTWTQEEREFGFAHWDDIYAGRHMAHGTKVRPLPSGKPLVAFTPGTAGAEALDRFITDQQVAGLIVLQDGRVRFERYARGHSAAGRWTSQSVAKAVTSTLVGAALKDGFIASLDDVVTKYIVTLRGSAYDDVTVRHLLTMTSGVKWTEDYNDPSSDLARFYAQPVTPGLNATVSFMRGLPREAPPGTRWVYKTGETHLLGVLVTSATRQTLADYPSAKIWAPYGMERCGARIAPITSWRAAACRPDSVTTRASVNWSWTADGSMAARSFPTAGSRTRRDNTPLLRTRIRDMATNGGSWMLAGSPPLVFTVN